MLPSESRPQEVPYFSSESAADFISQINAVRRSISQPCVHPITSGKNSCFDMKKSIQCFYSRGRVNIFPPQRDGWHTKLNNSAFQLFVVNHKSVHSWTPVTCYHNINSDLKECSKLGILPIWTCQNGLFFPSPRRLWRALSGYLPVLFVFYENTDRKQLMSSCWCHEGGKRSGRFVHVHSRSFTQTCVHVYSWSTQMIPHVAFGSMTDNMSLNFCHISGYSEEEELIHLRGIFIFIICH